MSRFRIARVFSIDAGHRLVKHPELCRFPHGHTYRIEVVLRARTLDANDMVCDYKVLKLAVARELERFDHSMILAADDPEREAFASFAERVVALDDGDPTTEVLARHLFRRLRSGFGAGVTITGPDGAAYSVPDSVEVERVRVWETPSTWAEYGEEGDG